MIQTIVVALVFLAAVLYLARMVYKSFQSTSCESGCVKCGAVDFAKIEKQIKAKGL